MPIKPAQLSPRFGPDAVGPPANRRLSRAERLALTSLAVLGALGVAAWQIPPMLDWSHTKAAIASYASARLGRRVAIGGQVHLTLLPRATLLADDVTLADRGDGISAKLGTLRLEVSIGGLLSGRVVPQSLAIESPVVTLPWPLPRGAAPEARPTVSREFAASMDGGTLTIAGITAREVSARFHTDPDTGTFGAQGTALVAGLPWRFTALVGAPGRDGVSALTLTLDGLATHSKTAQAGVAGTGGAFHGRILGDGSIAGNVVLRGPDLSKLGGGPRVAWQADGNIHGDGASLTASALHLMLGTSPGRAELHVRLASPVSVRLQAALGTLPAGGWLWRLLQDVPAAAPEISADLDISASAMPAMGAMIRSPHLLMSLGKGGTLIRSASADLPGGARIEASGEMTRSGQGFLGQAHLTAPDLRQTLHWLAGTGLDGLPHGVLQTCDIRGKLALDATRIGLSALTGKLGDSVATGSVLVTSGLHPMVDADLAVDRFDMGNWNVSGPAGAPRTLAALAGPFVTQASHIKLRAGQVAIAGLALQQAVFDGHGGPEGLIVHRLAADLPGGHFEASGSIGADGSLADGRLDLAAADAAALPTGWRKPARLWQGPFHLALTGAGPPQAIDAQLRADLGDLRGEAEGRIDGAAHSLTATVTLRHPGAPRLLDTLGLPGAEAWLGYGSLALSAHLAAWPGHIQAQDFSVSAASLQLGGRFDADLTGNVPAVAGQVDAVTLVLPGGWSPHATEPLPWQLLRSVRGTVGVKAAHVLVGLGPVADDLSANVSVQDGEVLMQDMRASMAGGQLSGQLAIDGQRDPPVVSVDGHGAGMHAGVGADAVLTPGAGSLDWSLTALSQGYSAAALLTNAAGRVAAEAHGIGLQGFDLAKVSALLASHVPALRDPLQAAMAGGQSGPFDGQAGGTIADGRVTIDRGQLSGSAGAIKVAGTIDLSQSSIDLTFLLAPAVAAPPSIVQHVSGLWSQPQRFVDIKPALAWAGQLRKSAARRRIEKH